MTRSRFSLLSLCVLVLGVLTFGANTAQASEWLFAEKAGTKLVPFLEASFEVEADTTWILHTKIVGLEVLFSCSTISAINGRLKAGGTIGEGFHVKLSGCITALNGKTSKACEPNFGGGEIGTITTSSLHGSLSATNSSPLRPTSEAPLR